MTLSPGRRGASAVEEDEGEEKEEQSSTVPENSISGTLPLAAGRCKRRRSQAGTRSICQMEPTLRPAKATRTTIYSSAARAAAVLAAGDFGSGEGTTARGRSSSLSTSQGRPRRESTQARDVSAGVSMCGGISMRTTKAGNACLGVVQE
ncbi:hypothetical protein CDD83_8589 [Cordyceps sp. RAO-2017]|nr:hypothetical protein CDD83_8589 [Cordyceps sp. RAO-2017]